MEPTTIQLSTILAVAGAISAIGGAWLTIRKLNADYKKERKVEAAAIVQTAKEEVNKAKTEWKLEKQALENNIDSVQRDLETYKKEMERELVHMKNTYNHQILHLSEKIDELRDELRGQYGQLVNLVSKLIDSKD